MESYLVTQIFTACTRGDLKSVKRLIEPGVSPWIRDNQGNTLFHLCCSSVQCGLDVLHYLITVSNSVNYNYLVNNEQQTLLHLACHSGKLDFVEYLFNHQFGSFMSLDIYRHTPLYYACSSRHYNIVSFICNNVTVLSADIIYQCVKISTWEIMVPLLKKISFKDFMVRVIQEEHIDLAKLVTKNNVIQWLNVKTPFPLHYFATSDSNIVEFLVNKAQLNVNSLNNSHCTPLHIACINNKYDVVWFLTSNQNCDVEAKKGDDGNRPLHLACKHGSVDLVKHLVEVAGCDINARGQYERNCLHFACLNQHSGAEIVQFLFSKQDWYVEAADKIGNRPIHLACEHGSVNLVKHLVEVAGCDINAKGQYEKSCLHLAFWNEIDDNDDYDIVKFLSSKQECDVEVEDEDGNRILHLACEHDSVDLVKHLVEVAGCDINAKGQYEKDCLHFACLNQCSGTKIVQFLFSKQDWCVEAADKNGNRPTHLACQHGSVDLVKHLVEVAGCDINAKGQHEKSCLHFAFLNSWHKWEIIKFLTSRPNCDIETKVNDGNRILHLACQHGSLDLVKHLVEVAGCDINAKGQYEKDCLHFACLNQRSGTKIVQFLFSKQDWCVEAAGKNNNRPIHLACQHGSVDLVKHLVEVAGCDINAKGQNEKSCLHFAFLNSWHKWEIIKFLTSRPNCDIETKVNDGNRILHLACQHGSVDLVKHLVEVAGCDINAKGQNEKSCLHFAFLNSWHKWEIIKFLTSRPNCDIETKVNDGNRILHLACQHGSLDLVKHLVEVAGCDINAKGQYEKDCLHFACLNQCSGTKIVQFLFSKQDWYVEAADKNGNRPIHLACKHGSVDLVKHLVSSRL